MANEEVDLNFFEGVIEDLANSEQEELDENVIWCQQLNQLAKKCSQMLKFAHEFDCSPEVKYNGVRALMKIVAKYFVELSSSLQVLKENSSDKRNLEKLQVLKGQSRELLNMANTMSQIRTLTLENGANSEELIKEALENRIRACKEQTADQLVDYYNPKFFFPWLAHWVRLMFKMSIFFIYFSSNPIYKSIGEMFSGGSVNRFYAQYASGAHLDTLRRNYNNLFDGWFTTWLRWMSYLIYLDIKTFYLTLHHRQNDWAIDEKAKCIKKSIEGSDCDMKPIKCVLMKPSNFECNDLILFIHGGAFVSLTTDAYKLSIRPLIRTTGAAVLSVEYSLSPQAKYPVALQECLDVYLNLVSSNPIIGFKPKKIILMGDSAGGYFALAVAIAVAEIRDLEMSTSHGHLTRLPDAIDAVYPATSCCIANLYPSRALSDFILVPSGGFEMAAAYAGQVNQVKYPQENNLPWYKDEAKVRDVCSKINSRVDDPFFHLPGYKHFDRLKDVPLYIQVGEFDPLIDDSLALAKCWEGPLTLDVIPEVTHAWFQVEYFATKSFTGCNLVRMRIKEQLEDNHQSNKCTNCETSNK